MKNKFAKLIYIFAFFLLIARAQAQTDRNISFAYSLSDSATTSAGLFASDSTLINTLWSARLTPPGTFSAALAPPTRPDAPCPRQLPRPRPE
ncbi:hypothetical protein [Spirosoma rhododendri]|uniref:Uncharacterized protein n=1 Tax=Spirosoma rhododendri TaxID=2728024 RepID=A0A7L5DVY2_9BACT|nr:hypothetical protein [Spirosoma rhododendri]QJD80137.1 hypothetical protein HH216_18255 [Spirosoma rhododendri]